MALAGALYSGHTRTPIKEGLKLIYQIRNWSELYETHRTRPLKSLDWVPVPNNLANDGYIELVDHEEGPGHFAVWIVLLQIASRCEVRGVLTRTDGRPHDAGSLSRMSRLPKELIASALKRLCMLTWMEQIDPSKLPPKTVAPDQRGESGADSAHPARTSGGGSAEPSAEGRRTSGANDAEIGAEGKKERRKEGNEGTHAHVPSVAEVKAAFSGKPELPRSPIPFPARSSTTPGFDEFRRLYGATGKPLHDDDFMEAARAAVDDDYSDKYFVDVINPHITENLPAWSEEPDKKFVPFPKSLIEKHPWTRKAKARDPTKPKIYQPDIPPLEHELPVGYFSEIDKELNAEKSRH